MRCTQPQPPQPLLRRLRLVGRGGSGRVYPVLRGRNYSAAGPSADRPGPELQTRADCCRRGVRSLPVAPRPPPCTLAPTARHQLRKPVGPGPWWLPLHPPLGIGGAVCGPGRPRPFPTSPEGSASPSRGCPRGTGPHGGHRSSGDGRWWWRLRRPHVGCFSTGEPGLGLPSMTPGQ